MRQRRQLRRQAEVREGLRDMRFPLRGALQPFAETLGLAELETHALRGLGIARRRTPGAEGRGEPLLVVIQVGGTIRQAPEHLLDLAALFIHGIAPLAGRHVAVEMQRAVHDRQVVLVVQEAFAGGDLGVDADPEVHFLLQFRRHGDARFGGARGCRGTHQQQRRTQQWNEEADRDGDLLRFGGRDCNTI